MSLSLPAWARHAALRARYTRQARAHQATRLREIQAALDGAPPGYLLLAGDSHAELTGRHGLGGLPLVNAGIGGMSARGCALHLPQLHVPVRARVAMLFTGANDIMARAAPLSPSTAAGFEAAVTTLLGWLGQHADQVVVLAVPPITPLPHAPRELAAVGGYSSLLSWLADRHGCTFADPYAALRNGTSGLARPGTLSDGAHLADYGALADALLALLDTGPSMAAPALGR